MSWQLKGWLVLTSALVATALVASTAGAGSAPRPDTAALAHLHSTAAAAGQPQVATVVIKPSLRWYGG